MSEKPKIIEIDDSSDEEIASACTTTKSQINNLAIPTISNKSTNSKQVASCSSLTSDSKTNSENSDVPKKIMSRRKSAHHSIRSTENLSFEFSNPQLQESTADNFINTSKKKRLNDDSQIDEIVHDNINNPDMEQMLKKIAYCRVYTNYLLQQYDMLGIDFKLYSNLNALNVDLKLRTDTYNAIRKSRQRFKESLEKNKGNIQL